MSYRIEKDSLGEVRVPSDKYWGAQTERSRENFPIGHEKMPEEIIHSFAILKYSAAKANYELGLITEDQLHAIEYAKDLIIAGSLNEHFPLVVWQTGSGTQSNMNINEVIASVGNEWLEKANVSSRLHPNDDVNKSQSSNDTYPTAMHIAFVQKMSTELLPAIEQLQNTLTQKVTEFKDIVKIGRTHLQDATPLTLGQEISGWERMVERSYEMIQTTIPYLQELAIGGTAVGTGLNAPPTYSEKVCTEVSRLLDIPFKEAPNKFHSLTSYDEVVFSHGAIKALAADLMKIANDVRHLASGPRSGIGELRIPTNEPGSSIMPGKINPTQCEALTMVCAQVFGNDTTIGISASQGNFELNVYKPVIAYNFLQSCTLLTDAIRSFDERCLSGIEADEVRIEELVEQSLMLVTALNPHLGYDRSAEIANLAFVEELSLKEAAIKLGYLTESEFDSYVNPKTMTNSKI